MRTVYMQQQQYGHQPQQPYMPTLPVPTSNWRDFWEEEIRDNNDAPPTGPLPGVTVDAVGSESDGQVYVKMHNNWSYCHSYE